MLVPVVGPSGAGKDTLMEAARLLLARDTRFIFARRHITRPAEAGGENHFPISVAEFRRMEQEGGFALWWEAHGLLYGIPSAMEVAMAEGRVVVANLSRTVLAEAAARYPIRILNITAPPSVLAARLAARGRESAADIEARLAREAGLPAALQVETVQNDGSVEQGVARVLAALNRAAADARPAGRAHLAPPG